MGIRSHKMENSLIKQKSRKDKKMQKIFAIKDLKMNFGGVFVAPNRAAAIRLFADTVNRQGTMLYEHAEDFDLYDIGEFDDDTGAIESKVTFIEHATNLKKAEEAPHL